MNKQVILTQIYICFKLEFIRMCLVPECLNKQTDDNKILVHS